MLENACAYLSDHGLGIAQPPPCVVLVGKPGMGKTTLAKRIIQHTGSNYDYVFLLSAESEPKLLQGFKDAFRLLSLHRDGQDESGRVISGLLISHLMETGTLRFCSAVREPMRLTDSRSTMAPPVR